MKNPEESADEIIAFLNEAAAIDPMAMGKLIADRVSCNGTMADHPTIQVTLLEGGYTTVGFLGMLNGIIGAIPDGPKAGWGYITAQIEEDGSCSGFLRTMSKVETLG